MFYGTRVYPVFALTFPLNKDFNGFFSTTAHWIHIYIHHYCPCWRSTTHNSSPIHRRFIYIYNQTNHNILQSSFVIHFYKLKTRYIKTWRVSVQCSLLLILTIYIHTIDNNAFPTFSLFSLHFSLRFLCRSRISRYEGMVWWPSKGQEY